MLNSSLQYKKKLLEQSGINFQKLLMEIVTDAQRISALAKSGERVPFNAELMKQAITYGMEVGLSFKSNNEKYTMPIAKMRTILPVALGKNKYGKIIIRGIHEVGQSESEAIKTGVRSAEANNKWRLFKSENIKGMWFTGKMFTSLPIGGFSKQDSAMTGGIISEFNPNIAAANQKMLIAPSGNTTPASSLAKPSEPSEPGTGEETLY